MCPKSCENRVRLTHDMLQSVNVSGVVIYHISNVSVVLQYTRITALYNTSVIFLAVQNNYFQVPRQNGFFLEPLVKFGG